MSNAIAELKPGQVIRCTIVARPRRVDRVQTVERLMRMDSSAKRSLRRGQARRRQDMVVYNRGNRDWYKRERTGRIVGATAGRSWTMTFVPQLAGDMQAVSAYLKIETMQEEERSW